MIVFTNLNSEKD